MLKKASLVVVLLVSAGVLTAMGGGRGGDFGRAPRVEKNHAVSVTDAAGTVIEGEKFSWEGRLHFSGYLGMAQVIVPFDKVKELSVGEKKERKVRVIARMSDGSETIFDVDADARCYGEAAFGSFMLQMDEIKMIRFK